MSAHHEKALTPVRIDRAWALNLLLVLAVFYTLYFARPVLLPFAVAMMLNLLFAPAVQKLKRKGIPSSLSAAVLLLSLIGLLLVAGASLQKPAKEWLEDAPTSMRQLTHEFRDLKKPLEEIKELGEKMEEMTQIESKQPKPQAVEISEKTALDEVMGTVPQFMASLVVTLLISFFLLASGEQFSNKILTFGKSWKAKRQIIWAAREMQDEVSRYLRTVTLINALLGLTVGLIMWGLGVPNPELWGAMVAILNFAPYVGAMVSTLVLAVVGMATFNSMPEALMVPAAFLVVTSLEGAVITPLVLGNRMSLNPLVVFLSVVLLGWIWGVAGALIAVPLVCSLKVILANRSNTRPIAGLLGS